MNRFRVFHGEWDNIIPNLDRNMIAAIVSDPPYGMNANTDYTRFTKNAAPSHTYRKIYGDAAPFDPSPWVDYPKVILFGYNHFAQRVPVGSVLVWYKRREKKTGKFLSDCELAWMKGGMGVYLFHHVWDGFDRETERGKTLHPTQKPVALMEWCIEKLKLPQNAIILDPFCGSGSTGVAALNLGYRFIGIEREEEYVKIARERLIACSTKYLTSATP